MWVAFIISTNSKVEAENPTKKIAIGAVPDLAGRHLRRQSSALQHSVLRLPREPAAEHATRL